MAATFTLEDDFYKDGLGRGAPFGSGFVRRLTLALTTPTLVGTITPADCGFDSFLGVISVTSKTAGTDAVISSLSASSLTVTASVTDSTIEVLVHGRGV